MKGPATSTVHRPVDHEELEAVLTMLHAVTARVETMLADTPPAARWLSTSEAAEVARIGSPQTIRNWCRRFQIGICVRGVWQVDAVLLEKLLSDRRA
jgi:hypothetical protein